MTTLKEKAIESAYQRALLHAHGMALIHRKALGPGKTPTAEDLAEANRVAVLAAERAKETALTFKATPKDLNRARRQYALNREQAEAFLAQVEGMDIGERVTAEALELTTWPANIRMPAIEATARMDLGLDRNKVCAAEDCDNVFEDFSPSQSQEYCSLTCQQRIKRRRQRAKKAEQEKNSVTPLDG